jgi:hypothetical protein
VLGVRQRCANSDERRQNFSPKCTQKVFSTMHDIFLFSVFFVGTNAMNAAVKVF